ncbi:MAG: Trm112 family protein [Bacteroidota bacterium]|nr:Trm112 family protein [Bacteroidota bacterium]
MNLEKLLEILVCPVGKAELRLEDDVFVCTRCGVRFPIKEGIPIMLIEEAELPEGITRIEDLPCLRSP